MITNRRLRIYAFNGGCVEEAAWSDTNVRLADLLDFAHVWHVSISLAYEVFSVLEKLEKTK